jgi:hypothetical protein
VTCRYSGGRIVSGQLIALVDAEGGLDIRSHPMNDRGEGMTGVCRSTPELFPDGAHPPARGMALDQWGWIER